MTEQERMDRINELEEKKSKIKENLKKASEVLVKYLSKVLKIGLVVAAIGAITIPTLFFKVISLIGETLIKFSYKGLKYELGFTNKDK